MIGIMILIRKRLSIARLVSWLALVQPIMRPAMRETGHETGPKRMKIKERTSLRNLQPIEILYDPK